LTFGSSEFGRLRDTADLAHVPTHDENISGDRVTSPNISQDPATDDLPVTHDARLEAGDRIRRQVLGDAHVDRSRSLATPFTRPMQDLVTEFCWGTIWTRPGLDARTRSLINVAMLTALGKGDELRLHVQGAIRNGCSEEEVQEVLLQAAVYCGIPTALEATRHAKAALEALDQK
jgi:4-carboxymuconolactone decarboxylase